MSFFKFNIPTFIPKPFRSASRLYLESKAGQDEPNLGDVPDVLSFERIIADKASPPVTLAEFLDYLVYVQQEAEDLQFYLWLRDFEKRFDDLPEDKKSLSPACAEVADVTSIDIDSSNDISAQCEKVILPTAESRLNLYVSQPFRAEITKIVVNYLAPGGVRELNLTKEDRLSVLRGLQHTTHPSVFDRIRNVVFANTKKRSHPKFIRWAMANSNKPHRAGGYVIAAVLFLAAIAGLVTCFVYSAARPYRLLTALPFAMAVFTAASLMARICPVYYLWFHTRELPPWQMYQHSARTSSESMNSAQTDNNFSPSVKSEREDVHEYDMEKVGWSLDLARAARMDPLGPKNKWNNEPWVQSYERKSIWRKVFDKSDTIKEEGMLIVLRKVLLQSLAWSVALTVVWTVIVISVP